MSAGYCLHRVQRTCEPLFHGLGASDRREHLISGALGLEGGGGIGGAEGVPLPLSVFCGERTRSVDAAFTMAVSATTNSIRHDAMTAKILIDR